MNHWQRIQDLFEKGLDLNQEQRQALLTKECASNSQMAQQLEDLWANDEDDTLNLENLADLSLKTFKATRRWGMSSRLAV